MKSLVTVGMTRRTVCGRMMDVMVWKPFMPREAAASYWPCGIDWMPARKISARYAEEFTAITITPRTLLSMLMPTMGRPKNMM